MIFCTGVCILPSFLSGACRSFALYDLSVALYVVPFCRFFLSFQQRWSYNQYRFLLSWLLTVLVIALFVPRLFGDAGHKFDYSNDRSLDRALALFNPLSCFETCEASAVNKHMCFFLHIPLVVFNNFHTRLRSINLSFFFGFSPML